jgi:hypothetical protein
LFADVLIKHSSQAHVLSSYKLFTRKPNSTSPSIRSPYALIWSKKNVQKAHFLVNAEHIPILLGKEMREHRYSLP